MPFFKSPEAEASYRAAYQATLRLWPACTESLDLATAFGSTHVLACGPAAAPPIIFLHAMSFSATMWYPTVSALSNEFRCYAVDFQSDMGLSIPTNPPATRADCVAWLREVLDQLSISKTSIVGLSYGGFLALNYALAEPTRVAKLVLASPAAGFIALPKSLYVRMLLFFLLPGRSGVDRILDFVFADRFPLDHPVIQQFGVGTKTLNPQVHRVFPKAFTDSELAGLTIPVYLLLGEKEVCYNPASAAKRARRLLPNASVEIFPNLGHMLVLECPDIVNPRISRFLHP